MKRIVKTLPVFLLLCALLSGCAAEPAQTRAAVKVDFTDSLGHAVHLSDYKRVVATSGSFAQVWLLAGGKLVGTTDDAFQDGICLKKDVADVGALHAPSFESILALDPQFVILSSEISGDVALYQRLTDAGIPAACFSVEKFTDYLSMLNVCTDLTGRKDLYMKNGQNVEDRIRKTVSRTRGKPSPRILLLRVGAGKVAARNSNTMAGDMLRDMGCINIADSETSLLDSLSMETIIRQDPDFIFTVTMGNSEEEAQKTLRNMLLSNPAWSELSAVKAGHYRSLPKDLFQLKPNNRWGESYETLWDILYGGK